MSYGIKPFDNIITIISFPKFFSGHGIHTILYNSFNRASHDEPRKFSFGGKIPWSNKQIFNFVTSL